MKKAKITYTVMQYPNGRIALQSGHCTIFIKDVFENLSLLAFLEVDLEFELKKQGRKECNETL